MFCSGYYEDCGKLTFVQDCNLPLYHKGNGAQELKAEVKSCQLKENVMYKVNIGYQSKLLSDNGFHSV